MRTATARKKSHRNKHLPKIVSICDCPILFAFYNFGKVRYSRIGVCAPVVIKTVNIVISRCCFAEDGTDLFIIACHTCSTLIFLIRPIKLFICDFVVAVPVVDAKAP